MSVPLNTGSSLCISAGTRTIHGNVIADVTNYGQGAYIETASYGVAGGPITIMTLGSRKR